MGCTKFKKSERHNPVFLSAETVIELAKACNALRNFWKKPRRKIPNINFNN